MSASIRCDNCRRDVVVVDPATFSAPAAGSLIAVLWIEHTRDCTHTCPWCTQPKRDRRVATCGSLDCQAQHREQKARDRIDDIEVLLHRSGDPEWIANQVGFANTRSMRRWLRDHGRDDLVDGPLAPELGCGIAV